MQLHPSERICWNPFGIGVLFRLVKIDMFHWFRLVLCHPVARETYLFCQKDTYAI